MEGREEPLREGGGNDNANTSETVCVCWRRGVGGGGGREGEGRVVMFILNMLKFLHDSLLPESQSRNTHTRVDPSSSNCTPAPLCGSCDNQVTDI